MLETLFIWSLIFVPLGIAVVLIIYRARFFVVGIIGIVAIMVLIWVGLRFAAMLDDGPDGASPAQGSSATLIDSGDRVHPATATGTVCA